MMDRAYYGPTMSAKQAQLMRVATERLRQSQRELDEVYRRYGITEHLIDGVIAHVQRRKPVVVEGLAAQQGHPVRL